MPEIIEFKITRVHEITGGFEIFAIKGDWDLQLIPSTKLVEGLLKKLKLSDPQELVERNITVAIN